MFVPGLGANPEDSWKSSKTDFNWTTHADGLQRDFPRARLLLYMYDSAWTGQLKVKQFMGNIAMGLLVGLRSKREVSHRALEPSVVNLADREQLEMPTETDSVHWT